MHETKEGRVWASRRRAGLANRCGSGGGSTDLANTSTNTGINTGTNTGINTGIKANANANANTAAVVSVTNPAMIFFFRHIRDIFVQSHTHKQQVLLSRKAFFQLLGYLGSCVLISLVAQSGYV